MKVCLDCHFRLGEGGKSTVFPPDRKAGRKVGSGGHGVREGGMEAGKVGEVWRSGRSRSICHSKYSDKAKPTDWSVGRDTSLRSFSQLNTLFGIALVSLFVPVLPGSACVDFDPPGRSFSAHVVCNPWNGFSSVFKAKKNTSTHGMYFRLFSRQKIYSDKAKPGCHPNLLSEKKKEKRKTIFPFGHNQTSQIILPVTQNHITRNRQSCLPSS